MYEVRDEGNKNVAQSTSLARAVSEAERMAKESSSRFIVVQVTTVHVVEPGDVGHVQDAGVYLQRYGRGKRPVTPVKVVPFSEDRAKADFFGGSFMGYPPEDLPPKHIDSSRTKPAPVVTDTFQAHVWETSRLGHGEYMCKNCKMTNREAEAISAYECEP